MNDKQIDRLTRALEGINESLAKLTITPLGYREMQADGEEALVPIVVVHALRQMPDLRERIRKWAEHDRAKLGSSGPK